MKISFIPFNDGIIPYNDGTNSFSECNTCKNEYSLTLSKQKYCKICLIKYVENLNDNNTYLDIHIRTKKSQCIEHEQGSKDLYTLNIKNWCKSCSEILHFNQIVTNDKSPNASFYKMNYEIQNNIIKCKVCRYEQDFLNSVEFSLCPRCYPISSEWIESSFIKKRIPILYLPFWDASGRCIACWQYLEFKSDSQKWCSRCLIIYIGCGHCLSTNIIFGLTELSECRKCKRAITIDIINVDNNLKDLLIFARIINISNHYRIVNYKNNPDQKSNSVYTFIRKLGYHHYQYKDIHLNAIRPIINEDICYYCKKKYSTTLLFEQKYCKICLYWYLKELSRKNMRLDLQISTNKNKCFKHIKPRNFGFFTQNIQEWCMNCSEIIYFKQIITKLSFDTNYYQNKLVEFEKKCNLSERQRRQSNSEFELLISYEWIESTLTGNPIPILYLPWWNDDDEQCIVCKHIISSEEPLFKKSDDNKKLGDYQKWCSNCFTIYTGCRYCLTTNIIFGFTNQSQCKKCKKISFITINTKNIEENLIKINTDNHDNHKEIVDYVNNNKTSINPLKIYNFISKLKYFDSKYINLKNNEDLSIPIIFIPLDNNENICYYCGNKYSVTRLFNQKYCRYCLYWFTKFTTKNMIGVHRVTKSIQCTEHESRNLDFCTQNILEWCMNCSDISYFKQIVTQYSFDMKKQIEITHNENCILCGKPIYSLMCSNCYSVSSGYIESTLTKKTIPILYLPWWDTFSNCIACKQSFEYKSDCQKWCSRCFIIYNSCRYCLKTNIIFGFTNQSQCIECKRVEPISINGNNNIDEFLNSTIDTNDEIANYMKNADKDSNPLNIYNFIKNKLDIFKNIKMIKYSETEGLKAIAKGGFGTIYRATWKINPTRKETVAVKRFSNSQSISKNFVNELKSFNQYQNRFEHIIKYYGITQDPKTKDYMIIMQYANGGDLCNYLRKNFTNITWGDKLVIILEISRGLDCIHKENFIHRDLHSGNILSVKSRNYSINYKWYIGDLGLSQPANIISNDEIYGVIPYIAPEVFNGKAFSKESDIYSMGMIMWELTTGRKPFSDIEHNTELILKIVDGKRPEITKDTPDCFAKLIKKCWDPDPLKRPHIKEIRKTIALWVYMKNNILCPFINQDEKVEVIEKFDQAEKMRLELIKENKFGSESDASSHPGAIFTSRLLNSSSIISYLTTSKQKFLFGSLRQQSSVRSKNSKRSHSESSTESQQRQTKKLKFFLKKETTPALSGRHYQMLETV
ncbi:hypothetical protein RhiirA1_541865 [Rhizophagus irregularis]|uniref:Protein kinase domain-containing protein n=1 Tax=Rhizophagus irregularis TaxID=588596 RepID=A0A2N0R0V6_9GLOM|nr:hypothetical protein RhiirA1_541865 [Rhizophagus irregularis]